ncbi:MAG: hypothetical protein WCI46_10985, partial [Verrucomicrobiota bacterium]
MPEPKPSALIRPPRGRLYRLARASLLAFLLLALFHRPILHHSLPFLASRIASHFHLQSSFHLSGNLWSSLSIDDLLISPTPSSTPSPIHRISIKHLQLHYSLPRLLKKDFAEVCSSVEISQAFIDFSPPHNPHPDPLELPAVARITNLIVSLPGLFADRLLIHDFSLIVRAGPHRTEIHHLNLSLDPLLPGSLQVEELRIPAIPVWSHLSAETSYANRNLFFHNLQLTPHLLVNQLNLDASQRAQKKSSASLHITAFNGSAQLAVFSPPRSNLHPLLPPKTIVDLEFFADHLDLDQALAYFHCPPLPVQFGSLSQVSILGSGRPENPQTWNGKVSLNLLSPKLPHLPIDKISLLALFENGRAELLHLQAARGQNLATLQAHLTLPSHTRALLLTDLDGSLKLHLPDLPSLPSLFPDPPSGSILGSATLRYHGGLADLDLSLDSPSLAAGSHSLATANLHAIISQRLLPKPPSLIDGLSSDLSLSFSNLSTKSLALDSLSLHATTDQSHIALRNLHILRGKNSLSAQGHSQFPLSLSSPADLTLSADIPTLADFRISTSDHLLSGRLSANAALKVADQSLHGSLKITGSTFQLGNFQIPALAIQLSAADHSIHIDQATVQLSGPDKITATGQLSQSAPYPYSATTSLAIRNLSTLQPLLDALKIPASLAGALQADWSGQASAPTKDSPLQPSGSLSLSLEKGRLNQIDLRSLQFAASYTKDSAASSKLFLASGSTELSASLIATENFLHLQDIKVSQSKSPVITGFLILPFSFPPQSPLFPPDGRLAINLNSSNLDLEKLSPSFGTTSPLRGILSANLSAAGSLNEPNGHLKLSASNLRKSSPTFPPANLDLDLHYTSLPSPDLSLVATLRHPQFNPITLQGHSPLDLPATIKNRRLNP